MDQVLPSVERAIACRIAMDEALATSAARLLATAGVEFSRSSDESSDLPAARIGALDFAAYCDLALAADALDAETKASAMAHLARRVPGFSPSVIQEQARAGLGCLPDVSPLAADRYTPGEIQRMIRWWDNEPDNHLALEAPSTAEVAQASQVIDRAMRALQACAPDLFGEITIIVRDVVIARSGAAARMAFGGGATSFGLWGSVLADPVTNAHWLTMYRTLVHEAAHNLLFALARSEPLVANDPSERFTSPVRADLRPMDGVYHAAFVSMRESLAFDALLVWQDVHGELDGNEAAAAFGVLEGSVVAFWECDEILRRDAHLTALGETILAQCEAFMTENFALAPA